MPREQFETHGLASISIMRKDPGDPRLYHSSSPLPLAAPIFDSNVDPNRSQFWRLVNVDMLVVMGVNITEDHGVSITSHSN